ncbi:MAG TPA: helix-turn-helix transcriptional regulator [Chthoniobacteraceae bacterium]|nr:helix-turn-helix transcriptional regulator [Chthoniobacteraceae bacterium]
MPERMDPLVDYLDPARRRSLREVQCDYRYTLLSCNYFRNRAPWSLDWRVCPDHFFLFPVVGHFTVALEGSRFEVMPGHFLMLPEKVSHRLEIGKGVERLEQISLHCHLHDRWGGALLARSDRSLGRLIHRQHSLAALKSLASLIRHDPESAQASGEAFLRELLTFQLRDGLRLSPRAAEPRRDPRVARTLERMESDFGSCLLSIDALAGEVGITATQLRKLFRRETGSGPKAFLHRLRLRKAARFLCQTPESVKEVAARCGFSSDHYFHLVFRKEFGCTPGEYRLAGSL